MRAQTDSGVVSGSLESRYPRARSRAVTDLGAIAQGEPRIAELLELLEDASKPERRIYILQEVARVYRDDIGDPESALVALRAALQEDYDHGPVVSAIQELASEAELWNPLLTELMEDATALADDAPRRAANLWLRISLWYDDPVGHREFAMHAVRQALELVPHHVDALVTLSSFLREDGFWVELVEVLERLVAVTPGPEDRIERLLALADVADSHLGDPERAVTACREALDVDGSCQLAFDNLRALLRRSDSPAEIAELLSERAGFIDDPDEHLDLSIDIAWIYGEQLADRERAEAAWQAIEDTEGVLGKLDERIGAASPAERAVLHHRIGWYRAQRQSDRERAEWHFSEALSVNPAHAPSLRELASIYQGRGDWRKSAMMLDRAIAAVKDARYRATLVLECSTIYAEQLHDLPAAVQCCQTALETAPNDTTILGVLAGLYAQQGQWSALQPILDRLESDLSRATATPTELRSLYFLIARCAAELGDDDRALAYYYEARTLDPANPEVLRGLGDQYFARQEWRKAVREYQALLAAEPTSPHASALHYRLGVAQRALGNQRGALREFRAVTELEPDHLPAFDAVAALMVELEDWPGAAKAKRALLELVPDDERAALLLELGDLRRDRLGDPSGAYLLYASALEARPDDHAIRQRKLELATELGRWHDALELIAAFAEGETQGMRRGPYLHAAAVIQRDELRDTDAAIDLFDRALDAFFSGAGPDEASLTRCMKTFVELDSLLTQRKEWAEQARAYRRMIKRLAPGHPLLGDLWHALGEIYRSRLKKYAEAAAAFEVARSLDPENLERRAILAELYQVTGGASTTDAAQEHQALLALDPTRDESYRALKEIYSAAGRMDQAWCACRALVFLDRANAEEKALYKRYQSSALAQIKARITPDLRSRLCSPDEAGVIASALGVVRSPLIAARVEARGHLGVSAAEKIDAARDRRPRMRMLAHMALALDHPLPDIYDQSHETGPLVFGVTRSDGPLRPVIAPRGSFLRRVDKSAAFVTGRGLSLLRPERILTILFTDEELAEVLRWILGLPAEGDQAFRKLLETSAAPKLRLDHREQLGRIRKTLLARDWAAELRTWRRAITTTSDRTGFVLSGDLTESARMIALSRQEPGGLTPAARISELVRFSVTDDHAQLRRHLCSRI